MSQYLAAPKNPATLRNYQVEAVEQAMKAIVEDGMTSVLIEAATGAGKTLIGHEIAKRLHLQYGYWTGWTVMRTHLLSQAEAENEDKTGLKAITYFSAFDKHPPTWPDVLIEDEGHHSAADTSVALLQTIKPKIHIALTATPFRTDRMKLCFQKQIKSAGLRQLIDSGFLSPYHLCCADIVWTPEEVANLYLKEPERWGPSVMFFSTLEECWSCRRYLRLGGVRSEVVEGGGDQETPIEAFERGDVDVLINVAVLTEGFDAPKLRTVFVRPGTKGPTQQMGGRAFRRHPSKPFANIVQNNATECLFSNIARPQERYNLRDGVWTYCGTHLEKIKNATMNSAMGMARAKMPPLPDYIAKQQLRVKFRRQFRRGHGQAE